MVWGIPMLEVVSLSVVFQFPLRVFIVWEAAALGCFGSMYLKTRKEKEK
jgi:hypothetical protein